jgi:flavodoxin
MEKVLKSKAEIKAVRVAETKMGDLEGINILIVGSPTRAFRATKPVTDFIDSLPNEALKGVKVAAFDTGIAMEDTNSKFLNFMIKRFGYAAKPLANKLVKKGGELILPPMEFWVKGTEGPLKEGELQRVSEWVREVI